MQHLVLTEKCCGTQDLWFAPRLLALFACRRIANWDAKVASAAEPENPQDGKQGLDVFKATSISISSVAQPGKQREVAPPVGTPAGSAVADAEVFAPDALAFHRKKNKTI